MPKRKHTATDPLIANVHRFRDRIGAYIGEKDGTAYLSPAEARRIGEALIAAAVSCETEEFTASNLPGLTITASTRS